MTIARRLGLLAAGLILGIEADPSTHWSIACVVSRDGVARAVAQDGAGPLQLGLPGDRADCTAVLHTGDRMSLTVTDQRGNLSRSTMSGAGSRARLRVG